MCVVCGCSSDHSHDKPASGQPQMQNDVQVDAHGDLHYGAGAARVSVPGLSQARTIRLEQDVLGENDRHAARNRDNFTAHGVLALNLVSSPGSGKTTLLCATLRALRERHPQLPLAVIEGDQQTRHDAERIRETGVAAIQINTGKGCHLDARMVSEAYARLPLNDALHGASHSHNHGPTPVDAHAHRHVQVHQPHHHHAPRTGEGPAALLFIENVGNLVCPASYDLGEDLRVVLLSVTEGEDKPLKYPPMFQSADVVIISKIDLAAACGYDRAAALANLRRVSPRARIFETSAQTGEGMDAWREFLCEQQRARRTLGPLG